ncbi:hypothetical protein BB559_004616 [Furculomyces boomerangus]|uniref:Uncharacterized protein n=1 Tax=Furculomyces boomerangus TaxID=61424 RepID=A0A2T9YDS1_9FUNG|nr:hypothetical protein BB559_004616 [Furculomyces boomerangus]
MAKNLIKQWIDEQIVVGKKVIVDNTNKLFFNQNKRIPEGTLINTISGFDISYDKFSNLAVAGLVVLEDCLELNIVEPYVAGFLAMREIKPYLELFDKYKKSEKYIPPQMGMEFYTQESVVLLAL